MNFSDIIKLHNLNPTEFRLMRHGYKEINPLDAFQNDRKIFDAYQSFQSKSKFKNAKYIASFAPYHGNQALFLGVWSIQDEIIPNSKAPAKQLKLVERFGWPLKGSYYLLTEVDSFKNLSERLVIDWGGSTVSWVQKITNKPVIAIFPPGSIKEFENYESTILTYSDVKSMTDNITSNPTWYNALKSVNGIYCITDTYNGKLYIGSAYGKQGIWRRWKQYAETGHGGNKLLMDLLRKNPNRIKKFQFSVLEILPATSTPDDAIYKENLWKNKLGSRINGYNDN